MSKPKSRPALPVVTVTVREGKPSPVQHAAWKRLFDLLLSGSQEDAPAAGGPDQGNELKV